MNEDERVEPWVRVVAWTVTGAFVAVTIIGVTAFARWVLW